MRRCTTVDIERCGTEGIVPSASVSSGAWKTPCGEGGVGRRVWLLYSVALLHTGIDVERLGIHILS